MTERRNISTGTPWEGIHGYSRAVRIGNMVHVSGTTASDEQGNVIGVGDPYEQTRYILTKIEGALTEAGATLRDVVRTRVYVVDMKRWEAVARAHSDVFGEIRPASTLVGISRLVDGRQLVEIEADAIISDA